MRTLAVALTFLFTLTCAATAQAGPTAAEKCRASKEKAAGKHGQCHSKVNSKGISKGEAPDAIVQTKCNDKTTKSFTKAETKGGVDCLTTGDEPGVSAALEACANDLTLLITDGNLPGGGTLGKCDSKKLKAAGGHLSCKYKARSKAIIKGIAPDFAKCDAKLTKLIGKFNASPPCSKTGDQPAIEAVVDGCFANNAMDGNYPATSATSTMDCNVLGLVMVALPVDLTIKPTDLVVPGTTVGANLSVTVNIDEPTADSLVTLLQSIPLPTAATIDSSAISTGATAGADSPNPQSLILTGPIAVDLADDPNMNTIPGPHAFLTPTIATAYDVSLAATSLDVEIDEIEVFLTAGLGLMLSTDPLAVPPGAEILTICTLNPVAVSFPVQ